MPEALFHVGPVTGTPDLTTGSMRTGAWTVDADGQPCPGSLGVLLDDVLGYAVVAARPPGYWAVTTEIFVDFCSRLPTGSALSLQAESRAVHIGPAGGVSNGHVADSSGGLVAVGSERLRFVPGEPDGLNASTTATPPAPARSILQAASPLKLLGAAWSRSSDCDGQVQFALTSKLANPVGNLHGGLLLCASEIVGRLALDDEEAPLVTSSIHIAFLRPVPLQGSVIVRASVQHRGRTLGVAQVASRDRTGKVCALATVTGRGPP